MQGEKPAVNIWHGLGLADIALVHRLEPDGLPDSGGCGIPEAVRFEHLLAALLPPRVCGIVDADDEIVIVRVDTAGNIEAERAITAGMCADKLIVYPHLALPIHRAEMQDDLFAVKGLAELEGAVIPEQFVRLQRPLHARESALNAERYENLSVEAVRLLRAARGD